MFCSSFRNGDCVEGFSRQKIRAISAFTAELEGRIQGVGFRPFIYRLATIHGLKGWVRNSSQGVQMHVEGTPAQLTDFLSEIKVKAPPAARVESIRTTPADIQNFPGFTIVSSKANGNNGNRSDLPAAEISPDLAVCPDCLEDIKNDPQRKNYPFTNCTNCGPRFSIIKGLPYDREKTTMAPFVMCKRCSGEYENVMDRRFHAQPNSCSSCGPEYSLHGKDFPLIKGSEIFQRTADIIMEGGILAIKGIGGYHLACDPFNGNAVTTLRKLKNREGKPFALMFADLGIVKNHAHLTDLDKRILHSPQAPIVILKQKKGSRLSPEVNRGLDSIGCFLPYTPFYHILFHTTDLTVLILTSGNREGEPIIKDNRKALSIFLEKTDGVLTYNREIHNRCDDSVGFTSGKSFRLIRRSRGYAPDSITLNFNVDSILAAGGDLKSTFCIGKAKKAIISQHIGNLENPETYTLYKHTVERYRSLFGFTPKTVIYDLHPGYRSTAYAKSIGIPAFPVQHHHAHIASCLAENREQGPVIGFSFDGTGYGDDGTIWGGEVFIADLLSYKRKLHLTYIPLPGGDKAVREPWRMALAALKKSFCGSSRSSVPLDMPFLREIDQSKIEMILNMIDRKVNTPLTSSMGRLFDAAAAMHGLCSFSTFEAEGPLRLESMTGETVEEYYTLPFSLASGEINTADLIIEMSRDILKGTSRAVTASKFHNSIIRLVLNAAMSLKKETGIKKTALSGGVFNNRKILTGCIKLLENHGFTVLTQSKVPCGDGGLSLGQLVIGAAKLKRGEIPCV